MGDHVVYDRNDVTADAAGCYVTLEKQHTDAKIGPIFICISQCHIAAQRLLRVANESDPCLWRLSTLLALTPENARSIATKLHAELSERVLKAAIELLNAEVVTTENAREVASLQEAVMFKTGTHYGPQD